MFYNFNPHFMMCKIGRLNVSLVSQLKAFDHMIQNFDPVGLIT